MYTAVKYCDTITYLENGTNKIYNFFSGKTPQDSHILYVDCWDGSAWRSASQGSPTDKKIISTRPAVITYPQNGVQKIDVYLQREDGNVWANTWDGTKWSWVNHGSPPPKDGQPRPSIASDFSALTFVTFPNQPHTRQKYIFGTASDHHLWVLWNRDDGAADWNWADLKSPGADLTGKPSSVYYVTENNHISVFVSSTDTHVYACVLNGGAWHWEDRGSTGTQQTLSTVAYIEGGVEKFYVFAAGADNHLRLNWFDGAKWNWSDQGLYASGCGGGDLSAITYSENGARKIYAFATGSDGHLRVNWWNGKVWQWADEKNPCVPVSKPCAITFSETGSEKIYVFVTGANALPYVCWWSGSQWAWHAFGAQSDVPLDLAADVAAVSLT